MSDDFFDFGFTAVDEDELEAVQKINKKAEASKTEASSAQTKLDKLYNAITPLLNNLKNPYYLEKPPLLFLLHLHPSQIWIFFPGN